jgi:tRNA threonylcarbamoyladenosine biosynthesis protein TsaE
MFTISSDSVEKTLEVGEKLGRTLVGGEVLALTGELGAGKTVFVKGLALGLNIKDVITSPTFVLVKSYEGRLSLHHIDFYRLENPLDLESIGFEYFLCGGGVVAIEWAEKFMKELPLNLIQITLQYVEKGIRQIHFASPINPDLERQWRNVLSI